MELLSLFIKNSTLCQVGKDGNLFFSSFVEYRQPTRTNAEMLTAGEGCATQAGAPRAEGNQRRRPGDRARGDRSRGFKKKKE